MQAVATFRKNILQWYDQEFRALPWRQTDDPYKIWISEIMLQQTQVKKVIPYYERFIQSFATVENLAQADLDRVLKLWEGLGYYSRARNLHKSAQMIVDQFNGKFPDTLEDVQSLNGIGPYTAAAILSIAFNQPLAVVDGNVNRVLARVCDIAVNPKSHEGKKRFQQQADALLDTKRPGDYNQAIMELGAMICRPQNPQCMLCPVSDLCRARLHNKIDQLPVKSPRRDRPHKNIGVALVWKDNKLLIDKRPETSMLGGLWEFPGGKIKDGETAAHCAERETREELGIDIKVDDLYMQIEHHYTHFSVTLHVYTCRYVAGEPQAIGCTDWRWVSIAELDDYAFPRGNGKIIEKLRAEHDTHLG